MQYFLKQAYNFVEVEMSIIFAYETFLFLDL